MNQICPRPYAPFAMNLNEENIRGEFKSILNYRCRQSALKNSTHPLSLSLTFQTTHKFDTIQNIQVPTIKLLNIFLTHKYSSNHVLVKMQLLNHMYVPYALSQNSNVKVSNIDPQTSVRTRTEKIFNLDR